MNEFDENDIDRQWSGEEIQQLSELEFTKLQFLKNFKNLIFFAPIGIVVLYLVTPSSGLLIKTVSWATILVFAIITLESLFALLMTLLSIGITLKTDKTRKLENVSLKIFSCAISIVSASILGGIAFLIYTAF